MPTFRDDTHKIRTETAAPPLLLIDSSRPFAPLDPTPSVCPAFSLHHLPSVSSPSALAEENSCLMTFDSRLCKGCSSSPFQTLRSSANPVLLPPDCSLPLNRRPRLPGV